jgi:hypothetical protein
MAKTVKFESDDLQMIKELQNEYMRITSLFGQMKITQLNIEKQEQELMSELNSVRDKEQDVLAQITEKYGPGQLDPTSGTFTPIEVSEELKK